jgi:hypothetical protein
VSLRRSLAVRLLTVALALAGTQGRTPQVLRAWIDAAAEVASARPAVKKPAPSAPAPRPTVVVARRPASVPPLVVGGAAWPPDRDVLALKHARLI